jgi:septum formation protein
VRRLVLASESKSRYSILRSAGFFPEVKPSGIEEDFDAHDTSTIVHELACQKAGAVAATVADAIVIGCDSLLDLYGVALGKPASIEQARDNWIRMRGNVATLMTGHCLIDSASNRRASAVVKTEVTFAVPSDLELESYLATGESLDSAGGFTLEGFAAPFVARIDGDALNVMGISPATVRLLLGELGISLQELWPNYVT